MAQAARKTRILKAWAAALTAWLVLSAAPARAATELIMFVRDGCQWCARFEAEIGPAYPHTAESRCAPLRHVDVNTPRPADLADVKGIVYTPTFVVMEDGREVGRLTGYAGEDFFWDLLAPVLAKLRVPCAHQ